MYQKKIKFPDLNHSVPSLVVDENRDSGNEIENEGLLSESAEKSEVEKEEKEEMMLTVSDVINHMVIVEPKTKDEVNQKLVNVINVLKDDLSAIERVAREISEDAGMNGVKYFEVGLDPTKFVTNTDNDDSISYTDVVKAALKGFKEAFLKTGSKVRESVGTDKLMCCREVCWFSVRRGELMS